MHVPAQGLRAFILLSWSALEFPQVDGWGQPQEHHSNIIELSGPPRTTQWLRIYQKGFNMCF